ncbi:MAG TPA: serine/threonine-protein kinase, partial [Polyangiaceae bacterium]|nr:serine/threonine-protein kinase [Polyangiaceae bacterium]
MADTEATTQQALTAEWDVRGIDMSTLALDARGTIRGMPRSPERDPLGTLPSLLARPPAGGPAQFELGTRLGGGGMGVVHAAQQNALRRDVAIKVTHPNAPLADTYQLIREARVTGALEHPNVVPIHALGRDDTDRPVIVMKRIEGTSWEEMLNRQQAQGRGEVLAQLERHLSILIDVTRAVSFAHARGIVHRDIKPANVMIGTFREVYLVDWGIAVALRSARDMDLPLAREVREVIGSPAYMAPEMAAADGERIDERTDVYLLGATLHEVLTGAPPHHGGTPVSMLTRAYASTPLDYDNSVPSELVSICHTAMHREPERRYQTAASFANALEQFIEHQGSIKLAEEASAKLEQLRDVLATRVAVDENERTALYNSFNDCRFSFLNALRIWESNTRAREQLQETLELMIHYELEHGSAGAAAALIAELPIPQRRLAERVEKKRIAEGRAGLELANLRQRLDPTLADRPRAPISFLSAAVWGLSHGALVYLDRATNYVVGHLELTALYIFFTIATLLTGFVDRRFMSQGAAGLKVQLTTALCIGGAAAVWPLASVLGLDLGGAAAMAFLVSMALWTGGALAVDQRFGVWTITLLIGLALTLVWPQHAL